VLGGAERPGGKRLAPMLAELIPLLRRHQELDLDATADLLIGMSAATIDRKLAGARSKLLVRGRSHTKPGSMLKSRIAMRTWADHDEDTPGFVEIDLVGHEGGNPRGRFCFTLTVTDIATGWTENPTVPAKRQVHVVAALIDVVTQLPFPIRGIDSDSRLEFTDDRLYRHCRNNNRKATRSRSGNKDDGAHVEQKNRTAARQLVGYLRHEAWQTPDTTRGYRGCQRRGHLRTADRATSWTTDESLVGAASWSRTRAARSAFEHPTKHGRASPRPAA
jgi:hypothetical protein